MTWIGKMCRSIPSLGSQCVIQMSDYPKHEINSTWANYLFLSVVTTSINLPIESVKKKTMLEETGCHLSYERKIHKKDKDQQHIKQLKGKQGINDNGPYSRLRGVPHSHK